MLNGICILPIIPMRKLKSDKSEMINQVLFGETFKILEKNDNWSRIKLFHDGYTGWIDNKQYTGIQALKTEFNICNKKYCNITINTTKQPLLMGSLVPKNKTLKNKLLIKSDVTFLSINNFQIWFLKIAKKYLNTPYMWGGRTPIGIDCSGYSQMVYRFFKLQLPRDANQQAKVGKKISSIQKIKLGDLAFFNSNKLIDHVGIVLNNNTIIHASGKVRIDKLDKTGIFNKEKGLYTHKLKLLRRVFNS